jgi:quercetin dioxygenase-like cupin family protein
MKREPYFPQWEGRDVRERFPGVRTTIVDGERIMLMRVEFSPSTVVPAHQHPHEQYGFVLEGQVDFTIGGETRRLGPGEYYAIPGGTSHGVVAGQGGAVCMDIFSPPRDEYRDR